ncbi:MAG: glycosyltransferase [Luteolibacter sp.]|jgi:glycosyltransferase involved in cell wall biosynthesis|nr:glycosyltransferase [Luteolibacter sp.]
MERPDILHIRSRLPGWIAWLAWRKMDPATRPRLVSTVHGFYSVSFYSAVMTKGERVIAVSNSIKDYILKNYPSTLSEKITVIHRGVDPAHCPRGYTPDAAWLDAWRSEQPQLDGKTVLLLPGRITRWKGQADFLRLVAGLKAEGTHVHGLIAGETHTRKKAFLEELQGMVTALGLSDEITFLGHRLDVREVMAVSDLILSLSLDPEAFGRVTLEAMALGKPVVAYNHGGVAEQLLRIYPTGLVPVGDIKAAGEKCEHILERGDYPENIGSFTLEAMLHSTLAVYESMINTLPNAFFSCSTDSANVHIFADVPAERPVAKANQANSD